MRPPLRILALLLLAGLVSAACGARLPSDLRAQAANAVLHGGGGGGSLAGNSSSLGSSLGNSAGTGTGKSGSGAGSGAGLGGGSGSGAGSGSGSGGGNTGTQTGSNNGGSKTQTGKAPKPPGVTGGSCPTSASGPGIVGKTINIGAIADETGPVNGLFQGAIQGIQAYANYVNSTGGICGYSLKVNPADDGTNCSQNQADTSTLGAKTFALVGTFSLYDGCGEPYVAQHGVPDIHVALDPKAAAPKSHFDMEPGHGYPTGMFAYYRQTLGSKVQHVGTIVEGLPSAEEKAAFFNKSATSQGWKFVYNQTTSPTTSDWTSNFVTMCQRDHIQIFFESTENANYAAKMVNDEQQAGCHGIVNIIPIAYDQAFLKDLNNPSLASSVMGWNEYSLFFNSDEAAHIPGVKLLQQWFNRTFPGAPLNLYALFAWTDGLMFTYGIEHAGKTLTRASLIQALTKLQNFDGGGLMAPATPSSKTSGVHCYVLWKVSGNGFVRVADPSSAYRCDGKFLVS